MVSAAKRSSSVKFCRSGPIPTGEVKPTARNPALGEPSRTYGKKPQSLKPLKPWQTTTTGKRAVPSGQRTSPRNGSPVRFGSSKAVLRIPTPGLAARFPTPTSHAARRTKVAQDALLAAWSACDADAATMIDQEVRQESPLVLRNNFHQIALDLVRVLLRSQAQELREARHVRVDDDAWNAKSVPEDDVGGLAANARQLHQAFQIGRHLAAMAHDERLRTADDVARLVVEEAGAGIALPRSDIGFGKARASA